MTGVRLERLSPGAGALRLEEHPPLRDSAGDSTALTSLLAPPHRLAGAENTDLLPRPQPGQQRLRPAHPGGRRHQEVDTVERPVLLHREVLQVAPHLVPLTPRVLAVLGRDERSPSSDPANSAAGHAVAGGGRLRVRASLSRAAG